MLRKILLILISILAVFNIAAFLSYGQLSQNNPLDKQVDPLVDSDLLTDSWRNWINEQTEVIVGWALEEWEKRGLIAEIDDAIFTDVYTSVRKQLTAQATEMEKQFPSPYDMNEYEIEATIENTGPRKHFGPQTVDALMESFHKEYNLVTTAFHGEAYLKELDAKYPPDEWIQMLLDKEVVIADSDFYTRFLSIRESVLNLENKPEKWTSGKHGISPTNDFHTYRNAFVSRKIWESQQMRAAYLTDPNIMSGFFGGAEAQTFFPHKSGRVYVKRDGDKFVFSGEKLSPKQQFELLSKGIIPEGHEIIYLDENSNLLDKPPVPISPETLLKTGIPGPPWDAIVSKGRASEARSKKAITTPDGRTLIIGDQSEARSKEAIAGAHFQVHVQHPDRLITPISPRWETSIHRTVGTQVQDPRPVFEGPPRDDR